MWDVFISHASEDKPFVRQLAKALEEQGLKVWFDEAVLKLGDSLRRSIDQGLADSKYGIVLLSPSFFQKSWTQFELDGLVTLQMAYGKRILPVWHQVTQQDVMKFSPALAGLIAVSTDRGLSFVVRAVIDVVKPVQSFSVPSFEPSLDRNVSLPKSDSISRVELVRILTNYFNLSELQSLCFELDVDFEDLAGVGKNDKARELVNYLYRRGRIVELTRQIQQLRPNITW
jgi:hypothetical protein